MNLHLQAKGVLITTGTIVDATLIHAPSSTKNRDQSRDPEMHQTKKGKQWYFGMKAHVGVDSKTKIIHTAVATAANISDGAILPDLLHGEETRVWGDGAYQGQTELIRECAPRARDFTQRRCRYKGQIVDEVAWAKNRTKSKVRAKVEHVFQVMKLKFGFVKSALSRTEEERAPVVCHLWAGQSVCQSQEAAADGGIASPLRFLPGETQGKTKRTAPRKAPERSIGEHFPTAATGSVRSYAYSECP